MLNFKNKLIELRKANGLTQDELASKMSISRSAICNYEKGIREPSFETLEEFADIFNVSIAELIDESQISRMLMYQKSLANLIEKMARLDRDDISRLDERIDIMLEDEKYHVD